MPKQTQIYLVCQNKIFDRYLQYLANHKRCQFNSYIYNTMNQSESIESLQLNSSITQQQRATNGIQFLLERVGGGGCYQMLIFIIYSSLWMAIGSLTTGLAFFFDDRFTCSNQKISSEDCRSYVCSMDPSERQNQISWHTRSFIFEFSDYLICENSTLVPLLQSLIYIGSLTGLLLFTHISDSKGRKTSIILGWSISIIGQIIVIIAWSQITLGIGLFVMGIGLNSVYNICLCMINQQSTGHIRQRFTVIIAIFFALGQFLIGLIFELGNSSKVALIIISTFSTVILIILVWFVEETPLFLSLKDRIKLLYVLNKTAKINKKPLLNQRDLQAAGIKIDDQLFLTKSKNVFEILRFKSIRKPIIFGSVILFSLYIIYFGTSLAISSVGLNMFVNQTILAVSQIPSTLIISAIIPRLHRKKVSFIFLSLLTFFFFALGIFSFFKNQQNQNTFKWIQSGGLMVNRFILIAYMGIFFVHLAEMSPTDVRGSCFGFVSILGMVGSILSPYTLKLSQLIGISLWFVQCIFGFLALVCTSSLVETKGKKLKLHVEENQMIRNF